MKKNAVRILILFAVVSTIWLYKKNTGKNNQYKELKVLNLIGRDNIKTLDPVMCSDVQSGMELSKIFEGLLQYDYLQLPNKLIPNLAESMPEISSDRLVYTFKIKKGVLFHNDKCFANGIGKELKASDVVFSFKRLADPKLQAPFYSLVDGLIRGISEWRAKYANAVEANYSDDIEGIKALDDYTVQITLTKPCDVFLDFLAMHHCFIVSEVAVAFYKKDVVNHPIGTGPFALESFNPQANKIVYVKNPTFREQLFPTNIPEGFKELEAYAGKRLPFVDKVIVHIVPEEQPGLLMFNKGDVDTLDISRSSTIVTSIYKDGALLPEFKVKGIQIFIAPETRTDFFTINCEKEPFKNGLFLRQAMSMAFDREQYNKQFYNGMASICQSIISPDLEGCNKDYVNPNNKYDVEGAKTLLAKAGFPNGNGLPEVTIETRNDTHSRQECEFFQKCMKQIGINIKVVCITWPELISKLDNKNFQIISVGWSADFPNADTFLELFYKASTKAGVGCNYDNVLYNTIYETSLAMVDSPEKFKLYEKLNEIIGHDVPVICTLNRPHVIINQSWIKNFVWSAFTNYDVVKYLDVDLDKKKELLAKLK